ncbi:MAG: NAD(P)-dependent oxidoreductase [Hyphomicrobiales bacterium]|nr:NAD(P)-dependent oxidoreductase [Hyphomicrobiales bacterium]
MTAPKYINTSVIGIGQMGLGISKNIDKVGMLKSLFDTNLEALSEFDGRNDLIINHLSNSVQSCDVFIFIVPSTKEIKDFLFTNDTILKIKKGSVVIDLTTSNPEDSLKLSKDLSEKGIYYLDCGMTGGASGADKGTLTLMIGGENEIIEKVKPILKSFTNNIFHVGKTGSGHALKLIHNMATHSIFLTTVEAVRSAEVLGINPKKVIEVFNSGNARSYISEARFPNHILSETWDGRSRVSNLYKDLNMVTSLLNKMEVKCPYGNLTTEILESAVKKDLKDTDFTKLFLEYYNLLD